MSISNGKWANLLDARSSFMCFSRSLAVAASPLVVQDQDDTWGGGAADARA
jgi:hypothetical protein